MEWIVAAKADVFQSGRGRPSRCVGGPGLPTAPEKGSGVRLAIYITLIYYDLMARTNKTRFALLGLLNWKPMSGYDIKKIVDISLSHFWSENYGQIYPTLNTLVKQGWAKRESGTTGGGRQRHLYRITAKGRQAFESWIQQPTDPPSTRNELQLKLFLGSELPKPQVRSVIQAYQLEQAQRLSEYRSSEQVLRAAIETDRYPTEVQSIFEGSDLSLEERAHRCSLFLLTLRHGILTIEARLAWCREAERYLSEGHL